MSKENPETDIVKKRPSIIRRILMFPIKLIKYLTISLIALCVFLIVAAFVGWLMIPSEVLTETAQRLIGQSTSSQTASKKPAESDTIKIGKMKTTPVGVTLETVSINLSDAGFSKAASTSALRSSKLKKKKKTGKKVPGDEPFKEIVIDKLTLNLLRSSLIFSQKAVFEMEMYGSDVDISVKTKDDSSIISFKDLPSMNLERIIRFEKFRTSEYEIDIKVDDFEFPTHNIEKMLQVDEIMGILVSNPIIDSTINLESSFPPGKSNNPQEQILSGSGTLTSQNAIFSLKKIEQDATPLKIENFSGDLKHLKIDLGTGSVKTDFSATIEGDVNGMISFNLDSDSIKRSKKSSSLDIVVDCTLTSDYIQKNRELSKKLTDLGVIKNNRIYFNAFLDEKNELLIKQ